MNLQRRLKLLSLPILFILSSIAACDSGEGPGPSGPAAPLVLAFETLAADFRVVQTNRQWRAVAYGFPVGSTSMPVENAGTVMGVSAQNQFLNPSAVSVIDWTGANGNVVRQAGIGFDFASITPGMEMFQFTGGTTPVTTNVLVVGSDPRSDEFRHFELTGDAVYNAMRTTCLGGPFDDFTLGMVASEPTSGTVQLTFPTGNYMLGTSRGGFWDFASPEEVELTPDLFTFERWSLRASYNPPLDVTENVTMALVGGIEITFRFAAQGNQTCIVYYDFRIAGIPFARYSP